MWGLGHAGARLALALAGIRYRVSGREHVPDTAVVFCANHESNVDPPVLFEALHRRLHILYKAELHKLPIMGTVFDAGGFVPIERNDRESAMRSIARGAESLKAGNSFLIFPEGWFDHGHRGAGTCRPCRYQRRARGDAKGKSYRQTRQSNCKGREAHPDEGYDAGRPG